MIVMLDTSQDLNLCEKELGVTVEQLLTPLTRFKLRYPPDDDEDIKPRRFSVDNGGFSGFNRAAFESLLDREKAHQKLCRWVACPDVVASARRTLECFEAWADRLMDDGWPLALVAQDGIENLDIPWARISAIFIGGSTEWKMSKHAADVVRAGKICNKWVHAGRVNTPGRFEYFEQLGADSIDGTGLSRYSWMRERIYNSQRNPKLWDESEAEARP